MSRKPVHIDAAERRGKSYGRQAMWETMRRLTAFSVQEIAAASDREPDSVRTYIKMLVLAGIVEESGTIPSPRFGSPRHFRLQYRLKSDVGHEAPRLKADGTPQVEARDQMWLTMKIVAAFTTADLAAHASTEECPVSPVDAKSYCSHLHRAGYLAVIKAATPTSKAVYKLLPSMNTGPHAPKVQRTKVVFDPNRNKIMWHEEIEP